MLITCWSVKGGSGVSVVTAALAGLMAERHGGAAVVDLGGDQPAVLGLCEPTGPGVLDWCGTDADADSLDRLAVDVTDGLRLLPRGDGPALLAAARSQELVRGLEQLAPAVVVDAGTPLVASPPDGAPRPEPASERPHAEWLRAAGRSLFVTRSCYLSLRRAMRTGIDADGVVLLAEYGRALDCKDIGAVLGLPVMGVVEADPTGGAGGRRGDAAAPDPRQPEPGAPRCGLNRRPHSPRPRGAVRRRFRSEAGPLPDATSRLAELLAEEAPLLGPTERDAPGPAAQHRARGARADPAPARPARRHRCAGQRAGGRVGGAAGAARAHRRGARPRRDTQGHRAAGRPLGASGRPRPPHRRRPDARRHPGHRDPPAARGRRAHPRRAPPHLAAGGPRGVRRWRRRRAAGGRGAGAAQHRRVRVDGLGQDHPAELPWGRT